MKRFYIKLLLRFVPIVLAFQNFSCEKEMNDEYTYEIFYSNFLSIYGDWELKDLSGGIICSHFKAPFNFMTIYKIGRFKLIKDEVILSEGKIIIDLQTDTLLSISFYPEIYFETGSKNVVFKGNDSLFLYATCVDGCYHQYLFIRKK